MSSRAGKWSPAANAGQPGTLGLRTERRSSHLSGSLLLCLRQSYHEESRQRAGGGGGQLLGGVLSSNVCARNRRSFMSLEPGAQVTMYESGCLPESWIFAEAAFRSLQGAEGSPLLSAL